jgi:hypothetical protein
MHMARRQRCVNASTGLRVAKARTLGFPHPAALLRKARTIYKN